MRSPFPRKTSARPRLARSGALQHIVFCNIKVKRTSFFIAMLLLHVGIAFGQTSMPGDIDGEDKEKGAVASDDGKPEAVPGRPRDTGDADEQQAPAETRPTAQPSDDNAMREIEALKQQMAAMKEEYNARLEEIEFGDVEDINEDDINRELSIFGFYDLSFMWRHIGDGSFFGEQDGMVNTSPQFLLQHLNLYFSAQISRTISFLTELQFTFLPNGAMTSDFSAPERKDTSVVDPFTQQEYRLGGLMIQRAWLKWEPFQFLGVKAGYFLSPYGIWHEDHASTVRLSILPPFENDTVSPPELVGKKPIPPAQLGLQLYGRLFPLDTLRFDYAFTVSNGRGSADTVIDYDDNKGLGLRLKLTYSNSKVEVALGGYGYYGEYSDKFVAAWNEQLLERYKEYSIATDFLVTLYGVRLQAEYLRSSTLYTDNGRPPGWFFFGNPTYAPDTVTSLFYTLLAYQLPLDKWLGGMTITPYAGFESDLPKDELDVFKIMVVNFGLNFKPSSFVVLKLEGSRFKVDWVDDDEATVWTVAGQLAISF